MIQTTVLPKGSVEKLLKELQQLPTIEKKSYLNDWLIHFSPNNPLYEESDDPDFLKSTIFVQEKPGSNWRNLYLVGDSFGWDLPSHRFTPIKNTNWWYISFERPKGVRLHYLFSPNEEGTQITNIDRKDRRKNWFFDTRNKFTVEDTKLHSVAKFPGFTEYFEVRDAVPKMEILRLPKKLQGGRVANYSIISKDGEKPQKLIIVHDGNSAINYMHVDKIINTGVMDGRWPACVFVNLSISSEERQEEYGGRRGYPNYMADSIIPTIQEFLELSFNPEDIILVGFALGGWAAFDVVWNRPDAIKNVICQSTPFWWNDDEDHHIENRHYLSRVKSSKKKSEVEKIYLDVGIYETGKTPMSTYESTCQMGATLKKKKYNVMVRELLMGHRYQSWAWSLPGALDFIINDVKEHGPLPGRKISELEVSPKA